MVANTKDACSSDTICSFVKGFLPQLANVDAMTANSVRTNHNRSLSGIDF